MENNEIKKLSPNKEKDPAKPSMKWYAFLTDLGLYMYLVINALFAFSTVAGLTNTQAVSVLEANGFGYLWTIDLVFCILLFAMAAYALVTRFALAKFRAKAPMLLLILHGADAALNLAQLLVYQQVLQQLPPEMNMNYSAGTSLWMVIGGVTLIFINRIYFQKRKEFFKN